MPFKIYQSDVVGVKGTIFDPLGDGKGLQPRIIIEYQKPAIKKEKDSKAGSNGQKEAPGTLKRLASRKPIFGYEGNTVFGKDGYSAKDLFRTLENSDIDDDFAAAYKEASGKERYEIVKKHVEGKGVEVRELEYEKLRGMIGKDALGRRDDDTAFVTYNDPETMTAVLLHEYFAGHDHRDGDAVAQKKAKSLAKMLGDYAVLEELEKIDKALVEKGIVSYQDLADAGFSQKKAAFSFN